MVNKTYVIVRRCFTASMKLICYSRYSCSRWRWRPRRRPAGPQTRHQLGEAVLPRTWSSAPSPTRSKPTPDPATRLLGHHRRAPGRGRADPTAGCLAARPRSRAGPPSFTVTASNGVAQDDDTGPDPAGGRVAACSSVDPGGGLTSTTADLTGDNRPAEPAGQRLVRILARQHATASGENRGPRCTRRGRGPSPWRTGSRASSRPGIISSVSPRPTT